MIPIITKKTSSLVLFDGLSVALILRPHHTSHERPVHPKCSYVIEHLQHYEVVILLLQLHTKVQRHEPRRRRKILFWLVLGRRFSDGAGI